MIIKRKWKNKWLTPFAVLIHIHRSSHVNITGNPYSCQMTIEVSKVSVHRYEKKHAFLLNSMENKETHAAIMKTLFFDYYFSRVLHPFHTYLSIYHSFTLSQFNCCWVRWMWCNFYSNGYLYSFLYTLDTCHWLPMSGLQLHDCNAAG
jgi:hypothetical protein